MNARERRRTRRLPDSARHRSSRGLKALRARLREAGSSLLITLGAPQRFYAPVARLKNFSQRGAFTFLGLSQKTLYNLVRV